MIASVPPAENSGEAAATARIAVTRNSSDDTQTRQIVVCLDGQRMGELLFGQSMALDVVPGAHTIRVDNTWNRQDLKLEIRSGERLSFVTKSTAGKLAWFLLGFLGAGPMRVSIQPEREERRAE